MTPERRAGNWKPKEIRLPLNKMAGCPWNLLDARGARVAWCGYDNDHERTGELIANDILNLVAIGEAVGELLDTARDNLLKAQAEIDRLNKVVNQLLDVIETHYDDNFGIDATDSSIVWGIEWEDSADCVWTDEEKPELAAELERRSKA